MFGSSAFICVDVLPFVSQSCIHICIYSHASFPFYCCHTYVHVVIHSYIFPRLFTALFKLGLRFNFALKHLLFFTGSNDSTVRIWDVSTQQQVAELRGHTSYVTSVAFDGSGKYLASGEVAEG